MSQLLSINVNEHTEKKGQLTYLSWPWAWAEVLKLDAKAHWEAHKFGGLPAMFLPDGTAMVEVSVTINEDTKTSVLPVMDHRNKAIKNPDAFAINTAIMRCMTKAVSMHGLGLYIYAGEDLPEGEEREEKREEKPRSRSTAQVTADQTKIDSETAAYIGEVGAAMVADFEAGRELAVLNAWRSITDNDLKVHLWAWLASESKLRSWIKAQQVTS